MHSSFDRNPSPWLLGLSLLGNIALLLVLRFGGEHMMAMHNEIVAHYQDENAQLKRQMRGPQYVNWDEDQYARDHHVIGWLPNGPLEIVGVSKGVYFAGTTDDVWMLQEVDPETGEALRYPYLVEFVGQKLPSFPQEPGGEEGNIGLWCYPERNLCEWPPPLTPVTDR